MQENIDYNSLVADEHVNPEAAKSMVVFRDIVSELNKLGLQHLQIKGVELQYREGEKGFGRIEVGCSSE